MTGTHTLPGEPNDYDSNRGCPSDACVVAKIEQFERVLADQQASGRDRLEALKYVVHFIGDVHQPPHASNNNDRGGNEVHVIFMSRRTNLHAVWDTGIIEAAVKGDERAYALRLARSITPAEFSEWSLGNPALWANESHQVAISAIYNGLRHAGVLREDYEAQALPVVNERLARAGVRLAKALSDCLR